MKKIFLLICITLLANASFTRAQLFKENKYRSKEETRYYDSVRKDRGYADFIPESREDAEAVPYSYIDVVTINDPVAYEPFGGYMAHIDSLMLEKPELLDDFNKWDSLMRAVANDKIGPVSKSVIIKEERNDDQWAILYTDTKYDDFIFGGPGYWLAYSSDSGKTWKHYFTGLSEKYNYVFKENSRLPLWKDSVTVQIEADMVRQMTEVSHPIPAEFETLRNNIAVSINIPAITKDSDRDGLTDVEEEKMLLDPNNPDTDGDSIIDSKDKNPRFKSIKTDKSIIYETLIESYHPGRDGMEIDPENPPPFKERETDSLYMFSDDISLLVTNDPAIQRINLRRETMIIMSTAEYEAYKEKYPSHFVRSSYSPMFKCDKLKNTFMINSSYLTGGESYAVQKTKKGWKITIISAWIS
jgi:hypothetical protein